MNEDHPPRLFADGAAVRHVGEGLIASTLTRPEWTHEAHLAACLYIVEQRPDVMPEDDLPAIIRRFNESVGGINDETRGYHETITQAFIRAVRLFLARTEPGLPLVDKVNGLLTSVEGKRDWPLRFYSPERLFSVDARLGWIEPDLKPLPGLD